jgi:hypothetical protein
LDEKILIFFYQKKKKLIISNLNVDAEEISKKFLLGVIPQFIQFEVNWNPHKISPLKIPLASGQPQKFSWKNTPFLKKSMEFSNRTHLDS